MYNKLVDERPEVLQTLSENFEMSRYVSLKRSLLKETDSHVLINSSAVASTPPQQPLLHLHNGRVFVQSFRRQFTGPSAISLTERQKDALDALHFAAEEKSFEINFEDGDLLILNNLALLHSRSKFNSNPKEGEGESGRHLLKLFVKNEEPGWEIPDILKGQWAMMHDDRPGALLPEKQLEASVRKLDLLPVQSFSAEAEALTSLRVETFDESPPSGDSLPPGWSQNG